MPTPDTPVTPVTLVAILAAGSGRRLGGRSKAFVELYPGRTFAEQIARTCAEAAIARIALVLAEGVEGRTPREAWGITNPDPERGMLSSIQVALESPLARGIDALLVWPVDCPRPGAQVVRALVERRRAGAPLALPSHAGRRGHPALFGEPTFAALREAPPREGARAVVHAFASRIAYVDAGPEVLEDIDTPEDLARVRGAT